MNKTHHRIINGDSRDMSSIPNDSVHLIVTSPPYWQLKDYGSESQIGFGDTYEEYINNLNLVWSECHRVLLSGCRLCVNIGDQFARAVYYGRYKVIPIRTEIIKFCETIGFDYMGAIIWQKVTTSNTTGGAAIMGSFPYPRNGILKLDYEFILLFKKIGDPPKIDPYMKEQSVMTKEEWNTYFQGHWNFSGAKQDSHLAMFPEELPRRLIKMFSFTGETVLDPFLGSGTTSLVAKNLLRNSIGFEINNDFIPIIKKKIGADEDTIFEEHFYEFVTAADCYHPTFDERISKLPYVFKDPLKLDKKIDVSKLQFGSRISMESESKDDFFTVKEVISGEKLKLSNGLTVRLIGIKEVADSNGAARSFLESKTKGEKVFLKYDKLKYDMDNNLMVYLYLKNKTHINAHLLKSGLVDPDDSYDYKYKSRFLELRNL